MQSGSSLERPEVPKTFETKTTQSDSIKYYDTNNAKVKSIIQHYTQGVLHLVDY